MFKAQEKVYNVLGSEILDNALDGYNACIFAYGQTGKNISPICFLNKVKKKL